MSETLKNKTLILIMIASIVLTGSNSMPIANAQPTQTSLTITVPSPPKETECTIEATLKEENGNPLQNMDIGFYVCSKNWLDTAKTDSNGVASLTYTFPRAGTYNVTAMFSGTTNYTQSSSEYVDIIIVDYSQYLVGGGLIAVGVAIIGTAGYIVFRRRKKL
jgi:hypothetical protein